MKAFAKIWSLVAALSLASCDVFLDDIGHLGEPCSGDGQCYDSLSCLYGECMEPPSSGEECDPFRNSEENACEEGLHCAYHDDSNNFLCTAMGGEGQPCICEYTYNDELFQECELEGIDSGEGQCDVGLGCLHDVCVTAVEDSVDQPNSSNVWLRCPIGMSWDGWNCTGTAQTLEWEEATTGCPDGFTLPSPEQFAEILSNCSGAELGDDCDDCADSTSCNTMFKNNPTNITSDWLSVIKSSVYWTNIEGSIDSCVAAEFASQSLYNTFYLFPCSMSFLALCVSE